MSNVHIREVPDLTGDLVDLLYYHHDCAPVDALDWPAPEAIDYPVYCEECDERIEEVPLTYAGEEMLREATTLREVNRNPIDVYGTREHEDWLIEMERQEG